MKRYVLTICVFASSLIFLLVLCIMTCSAKMTAYLLEKQENTIIARGIEGLSDSKRIIEDDFNNKVAEASEQAFNMLTETLYNNNVNVTEAEAERLYRGTVLNIVKAKYGEYVPGISGAGTDGTATIDENAIAAGNVTAGADGENADAADGESTESGDAVENADSDYLENSLESMLPTLKNGNLSIAGYDAEGLVLRDDCIELKGIEVDFACGNDYRRSSAFDVSTPLRNIVLYDENPDVFPYAMIAGKGIYITGKTSTVIGNVYAGKHPPSELRKAEALYGESGNFGGVNIMSTQVAIYADEIVSEGDLNMKGAFAVIGSEGQPVTIYADNINQTDNVASRNIYALFGSVSSNGREEKSAKVSEALSGLENIDHYYDTDNDITYTGSYRKIISSNDITIKKDVTGIVMTPGNVIIEDGVNVEGLIICGDRIYVQGNNNIVSSVEVLRGMLKEELYEDVYESAEDMTIEEQALYATRLYMKDYLGGILRRGMY